MVQGGRKASHKSFSGTWFDSCDWENSFWTNQLFFILIKDLNWNQVFAFLWLRTTKMIETRFLFILFIDVLFILSDAKDSLWWLGDQTQLSSSPLLASNSRWMKIQLKNAKTSFNFILRDPNMLRKRRAVNKRSPPTHVRCVCVGMFGINSHFFLPSKSEGGKSLRCETQEKESICTRILL